MHSIRKFGTFLLLPALIAVFVLAAPGRTFGAAAEEKVARINLNTAGVDELTSLPGIGPSYAKRIVDFREKNGPFKKVEDLLNVQGIGEKTLERIRERVTVTAGK